MKSSLYLTIQEQLRRFVAGELTLDAFRDWFTPTTWSIDNANTDDARELSYEIEHRLAEFTNGDWDEQELRLLLRPFAERRSEAASA
jgi:hypothetical protein